MMSNEKPQFGVGNASFSAAGGEAGIRRLVDVFYDLMGADKRFDRIYRMHPKDIELSREKLARFLCGWLGGPKRYQEKFGSISLPRAHQHLPIKKTERDMWLTCMKAAIDAQPFAEEFKIYLFEQLSVPAEAVRRKCET